MASFDNDKNSNSNQAMSIWDLPQNLQFKIFSNLDIADHVQMRSASKSLMEADDQYWRSEFKKAFYRIEKSGKEIKESVLFCLKLNTEIYIKSGFESIFYDCLLEELSDDRNSRKLIDFTESQLLNFLHKFYSIGSDNLKYSNTIYTFAFLHALKNFSTSIRKTQRVASGLGVIVEVPNVWLGGICKWIRAQKALPFILVALSKMLRAQFLGKNASFIESDGDNIFIYGYETALKQRSPGAVFDFFIDGSEELLSYMELWLTSPVKIVNIPQSMLKQGLGLVLKVQVKTTFKYRWPQTIFMQLDYERNEQQK